MKVRSIAVVALAATLGLIAPARLGAAVPTGVARYELRVDTRSDGSGKASLEVALDPIDGSVVVIPFPFAEVLSPEITGVPGIALSTVPANGQTNLIVSLPPGTAAPLTVRVMAEVPRVLTGTPPASRGARIALLNSQPGPINDIRLVVVFPEGLRGHAIQEALPRPARTEVEPRAAFTAVDGRGGVRLQAGKIAQGEIASLRVELADATPSPGWLLIGVLLGVFYLVSFRDLIARSDSPPRNQGAP